MSQDDYLLKKIALYQSILGELGFILISNGSYYKDYVSPDGSTIRVTPVLSQNTDESDYKLESICLSTNKTIKISNKEKMDLSLIPKICTYDINKMMFVMAPHSKTPNNSIFIITAKCDKCNIITPSFIKINDGYLCQECF